MRNNQLNKALIFSPNKIQQVYNYFTQKEREEARKVK